MRTAGQEMREQNRRTVKAGRETADRRRQHMIFIALFLLLQAVFVWRSFYGFNTADEMYFIGTSERIFRGEKILIDEWNPTQQLCSFLLHPVYCLIRLILGSTEGIVMASRFLYLIFAAAVTLFLYLRFQRRGYAAFGPALLFAVFAPFSICAMSYNSIEFAVLPVIVTLFLYLRFQRRGYAAFGPALLFAVFAPFSICAMSYNSIEFAVLPVILAVLSAKMEHSVPEYMLCGI